ncbi:MAG TPA: hypothetical protein VGL23_21925 [Chloroflexota bacterium]
MDEVARLLDEFRLLLRRVADGLVPIDDVEAWHQCHADALRACDSADVKRAVQCALVHTWSWRHGSTADVEARASLRALAGRLPTT